ncbi:LysR family transcriptional regulator [Lentibacillus saliphilus]|uniref:LysR family transcriptional regulator n=1 Tax=Lentibacillus saliphilus TaxID=2737028 RepID=UPI001C2F2C0F
MDIKHLQYFVEIAHAGSFTKAAEKLYITQPAISRMIKSLEDDLGTPLFVRSRKKLVLTDAGKIVYKHAQVIEKNVQSLQKELDDLLAVKKGHLRIGLPSIVNALAFSGLIASFHKVYPDVTFQLEEDGSKGIEEKILAGQLDFGVVVFPEGGDLFDYYAFEAERLKLVVSVYHPLAGQEHVQLQELKNETFILFTQDFTLRKIIIEACRQAGYKPKIISESSQPDFIEEMVASNLGITLLPESSEAHLGPHVDTVAIVEPSIEWRLAFIWRKDAQLSQPAKDFIRHTKDILF